MVPPKLETEIDVIHTKCGWHMRFVSYDELNGVNVYICPHCRVGFGVIKVG